MRNTFWGTPFGIEKKELFFFQWVVIFNDFGPLLDKNGQRWV